MSGCDNKPAPSHAAARSKSATSLPAKEPDLRTVAAMLEKQGGGSGGAALPPGHPPMGGAQGGSAEGAMPPGHPPMGGMSGGAAEGSLPPGHPSMEPMTKGAPAEGEVAALKFDAPSDWKSTPVTSSMRKAQYTLPRASGDSEDGQLIVFYFGRDQGGTVELNIDRWKSMFSTPEGQPVSGDKIKQATSQVNGMKVTKLDVTGRYADQMGRADKPGPTGQDFRMLAAIVETPDGPWFFKATGPTATMALRAEAFDKFVQTVHR
jgi:hypothetical protein